jgi:serine protease inhibitor
MEAVQATLQKSSYLIIREKFRYVIEEFYNNRIAQVVYLDYNNFNDELKRIKERFYRGKRNIMDKHVLNTIKHMHLPTDMINIVISYLYPYKLHKLKLYVPVPRNRIIEKFNNVIEYYKRMRQLINEDVPIWTSRRHGEYQVRYYS